MFSFALSLLFHPVRLKPGWLRHDPRLGSIHMVLLLFQESGVSVSCPHHQKSSSVTCDWIPESQSHVSPVFSYPTQRAPFWEAQLSSWLCRPERCYRETLVLVEGKVLWWEHEC